MELANDSEMGNTTPVMDFTQRLEEKLAWSHNVQAKVTNGDKLASRGESEEVSVFSSRVLLCPDLNRV